MRLARVLVTLGSSADRGNMSAYNGKARRDPAAPLPRNTRGGFTYA